MLRHSVCVQRCSENRNHFRGRHMQTNVQKMKHGQNRKPNSNGSARLSSIPNQPSEDGWLWRAALRQFYPQMVGQLAQHWLPPNAMETSRAHEKKTEYLKQRRGQLRGFWESSHSTNTNSILGKAGKLENKMALASKTGKGRLFALHFPPTKKKTVFSTSAREENELVWVSLSLCYGPQGHEIKISLLADRPASWRLGGMDRERRPRS